MKNFKFDLQNHVEETTVTSAETATTASAINTTSTSNVITAVVATVAADTHAGQGSLKKLQH